MEVLKKEFYAGKFNKEDFETLEKTLSFGLDIDKKIQQKDEFGRRPKISTSIHRTTRDIYVEAEVRSSKKCYLLNRQFKKHHNLLPKFLFSKEKQPYCFVNTDTNESWPKVDSQQKSCRNEYTQSELNKIGEKNGIKDGTLQAIAEILQTDLDEVCRLFEFSASDFLYSPMLCVRKIAYENLKYFCGCEHVTEEEAHFLDRSFTGALFFADKEKEFINGYDYDINSFYPYIMSRSSFEFPLSEGIMVKNTNKRKYPLEICKLEIEGEHKYFKKTKDNYYNTYQMQLLDVLGMKYKRDTTEERMVWSEPIKSSDAFGFMNDIFALKQKGNCQAKGILNSLWGLLGMKKQFRIPLENLREHDMKNLVDLDINAGWAQLKSDKREYKFVWGRIKTFITSYARLLLVRDYILPLEKEGFEIYQANTDGFITNAKPQHVKPMFSFGSDMGELKIEKVFDGLHKVVHIHKIENVSHDFFDESDQDD